MTPEMAAEVCGHDAKLVGLCVECAKRLLAEEREACARELDISDKAKARRWYADAMALDHKQAQESSAYWRGVIEARSNFAEHFRRPRKG